MSDNIKVAIRLRIVLEREQKSGQSVNWVVKDNSIAPAGENEKTGKPYVFDTIFDQQTTTNDIFEEICKPIVDAAIEGFHGTVIAYGQSSSGKTFTMSGTKDQPGVVPLAISELFNQIERATDREFLVRSSYMQIYNETIWDLLKEEKKTIQILEDSDHNVQLLNLTEEVVKERAHVVQVINKGDRNRLVAETKQNDRSSRSHCILRIIIESRSRSKPAEEAVKVLHLNFVDLAGSEKAAENTGVRFKEGCAINKSLLTLGQVINKLGGDESSSHVNYRDSKLTRILQNALGGNSKTAIICNISPTAIEDTINTLQDTKKSSCKGLLTKIKVAIWKACIPFTDQGDAKNWLETNYVTATKGSYQSTSGYDQNSPGSIPQAPGAGQNLTPPPLPQKSPKYLYYLIPWLILDALSEERLQRVKRLHTTTTQ